MLYTVLHSVGEADNDFLFNNSFEAGLTYGQKDNNENMDDIDEGGTAIPVNGEHKHYNNYQNIGESMIKSVNDNGSDPTISANRSEKSSILPKKVYTVIGKESSGTQFVTSIIRDALEFHSYREGGRSYEFSTKRSRSKVDEQKFKHWRPEDDQNNPIQVQHFSLPQGSNCRQGNKNLKNQIVDAVFPAVCTSALTFGLHRKRQKEKRKRPMFQDKSFTENFQSIKEQCREMKQKQISLPHGFEYDTRLIFGPISRNVPQANYEALIDYPTRYFLNITSHKQWQEAHGVEQVIVIVVRDREISFQSRLKSHCADPNIARAEERIATEIINNAIREYLLEGKDETNEKNEEKVNNPWFMNFFKENKDEEEDENKDEEEDDDVRILWNPSKYKKNSKGSDILHSSLIPARNNVVLVSYETMLKMKGGYVKQLYEILGIKSDFAPIFKDGNAKYRKQKWF